MEDTNTANGNNPTRLLSDACNAIASGAANVCAVAGAEALRTAGALAAQRSLTTAAEGAVGVKETKANPPDPMRDVSYRKKEGYAPRYGLLVPTDVYPLLENALRASLGQSLEEGQAQSGRLWHGMSQVAARNPNAWIQRELSAEEILTPSARNRPIAFPYTKLQVANLAVNQGAGYIVTSLAEARRRGLEEDRLVYPGYGAAANEAYDALIRERYDRSPSMEVSIRGAMEANGVTSAELEHAEFYSCFPCIPKMAMQVAGWPEDRPITVFGGLTFGGGPIGSYMNHAIAEMTLKLRGTKDKGLLFGNGGAYATHNHTIVLSGAPTGAQFPHNYDRQAEADALRGAIPPIDEAYEGEATIETYTVHYARNGAPRSGVVVARTRTGGRTLASIDTDDAEALAFFTSGENEPVGSKGQVTREGDDLAYWRWSTE